MGSGDSGGGSDGGGGGVVVSGKASPVKSTGASMPPMFVFAPKVSVSASAATELPEKKLKEMVSDSLAGFA